MLKIATLSSGSSGNCAVVSDGETHILIDAGISAKQIELGLRSLGLAPVDLAAVFITHEHIDHVAGLRVLSKRSSVPAYATAPTCEYLRRRSLCSEAVGQLQDRGPGTQVSVGSMEVTSFPTPHDAADSVGYVVSSGGKRLVLCTDLGHVTDAVLQAAEGCGLLVCETNHDVEMLKTGSYPYQVKRRILGDFGHLSNEAGGELALHAVRHGARRVVLGHLSQRNNTSELAYSAVEEILEADGFRVGRDVALSVARWDGCSGWMEA